MREIHFNKEQKRKQRKGFLWVQYEIFNCDLTSSDKLVYMVLARFADNETQECHPSTETISKFSGLTQRTVISSIKHLEKAGIIEVDRQFGDANYYQLNDLPLKNNTSEKISPVKNDNALYEKETTGDVKNSQSNNTDSNNTDPNNTKEKEINKEKEKFEEARKMYPGTKRGLDTEFANFQKKHKDWKLVIPLLAPAIKNQIETKRKLAAQNRFVPEWKHFRTWINQRCWEEEIPKPKDEIDDIPDAEE